MKLFIGFVVAIAVQFALTASHIWWVLAACQPLLLVIVAASRRLSPLTVGWIGLVSGLTTDLIADRVIGPGGIAGVIAGIIVGFVVLRFELEGPLFWIVGSLAAAITSELAWLAVTASLGAPPDHKFIGVSAAIATTAATSMVVAAGERLVRAWKSPARQRRRVLRHL